MRITLLYYLSHVQVQRWGAAFSCLQSTPTAYDISYIPQWQSVAFSYNDLSSLLVLLETNLVKEILLSRFYLIILFM